MSSSRVWSGEAIALRTSWGAPDPSKSIIAKPGAGAN